MVQTWGKEGGGTEVCEKCGAKYKVTIHRFPSKDSDTAHCMKCGTLLARWNSTSVPVFELIQE